MHLKLTIILILLFSLQLSAKEIGPANPGDDRGWVAFGLGRDNAGDMSGNLSFNLGRTKIFQLAVHSNSTFMGKTKSVIYSASPGISVAKQFVRIALFLGPSVNYYPKRKTVPGLSGSTQFIFTPIKELGIGLNLFGSINSGDFISGVGISFVLEGNK